MFETLFSREGLSLERLRVLVEVVDAGGIARAVGDNPVRQSQYSRQIKDLELFFGRKLTTRVGKTLSSTAAGRRLAGLAREHLRAMEAYAVEQGEGSIPVRVGAGESLIKWLIVPRLAEIESTHGEIRWSFANLQSEDVIAQLCDQRLDFGLVRGKLRHPSLKTYRLGHLRYALFVPRSLAPSPPMSGIAAVSAVPLAVLEGRSRLRASIEEQCRRAKVTPRIRFECSSLLEVACLIRCGLAAGILPTMAREEFGTGSVVEVDPSPIGPISEQLELVWNPRNTMMNTRLEGIRLALTKGGAGR